MKCRFLEAGEECDLEIFSEFSYLLLKRLAKRVHPEVRERHCRFFMARVKLRPK
jgi:hypothetical protein